jgi:hypothetical protein
VLAAVTCATVLAVTTSYARTIELTDKDADRMAVIAAEAPRLGWAAYEVAPGMFADSLLYLRPRASVLVRVPLDRIPAGSRITKAEWVLRVSAVSPVESKLYAWRILGPWGAGACYLYRTTRPKPLEWNAPGARGAASDRAERPTAVEACKNNQDVTLNVTEDVELWHGGAAPNNGWMFTVEEQASLSLLPPSFGSRGSWKLRITYEPR